jgi:predicted helicase
MSKVLINQYYNNLDRAVQFGKSTNEQSIRSHFWNLLNDYARKQNFEVVAEAACMGTKGKKVWPDGIVKNLFGLDIGLWESKDEKDSIDDEIQAKLRKGYPFANILFEDSRTAVLFQHGTEKMRVPVRDADSLHSIITEFISFRSDIVLKFEDAIEKFKADIPVIVETLRGRIDETRAGNKKFIKVSEAFLELCKTEINPEITAGDVREMMIQHILTGDIFNKIFDDADFRRHNNIARELEKLTEILFTFSGRKNLTGNTEHYYDTISSAAACIADHHEKQKFLKVLYENFYKVYNPKAADRLGVVYTPNEIVQFMIESADYLLHKHFNKTLGDKDVEILDPATGTGTFIASLIDYIPKHLLEYKYKNEIYANEVSILPYYIANLNAEFTFKQRTGYYEKFKNLCFADTLDNTAALPYSGQQPLFGTSSENTERIKRQNSRKISVIIGNPPYNANQANENDNNKNREYPKIDERIKATYVKHSTAQKTKVYDMYARFYRWASDRIDKNGVLAFITNRSFIDSRTFDGFRKCVQDDFTACYIIDTKSDVRANPKIAGTTHNVFGIQTGAAMMFLVKKEKQDAQCRIEYVSMEDDWRKEKKLEWLRHNKFENIAFEKISPDKNSNWINLADNDFETLVPLISDDMQDSVFSSYAMGVVTARDEWVYDLNKNNLLKKMKFFIDHYNTLLEKKPKEFDAVIKWSDTLKRNFVSRKKIIFNRSKVVRAFYRPYHYRFFYAEKILNDRLTNNHIEIFGKNYNEPNKCFGLIGKDTVIPFSVLAFNAVNDLNSLSNAAGGNKTFPLYRCDSSGSRTDNITDWGLNQFVTHYKDKNIKKEDIFHYTYAVLHNPAYRQKYELSLKREFPRLPFYDDFRKWADWGKALTELHIGYETVKPFSLKTRHKKTKAEKRGQAPAPKIKPKLKADKEKGIIEIDELTSLSGIPKPAWEYKLGSRSALEWILDQYKEKKPRDPTIAEKFNTYRFADYKDHVTDLLKRVCTVRIETMKLIEEMRKSGEGESG